MILKGFKEKSTKKYLNKLLSQPRKSAVNNTVESLGVIINIDEIDNLNSFVNLSKEINIHPNKLKVIAFSTEEKDELSTWEAYYTPLDFGWKGTIKHVELQSFLDTNFDALISYYTEELIELKLLTAKSKASFKIGVLQTDDRLNDLIIKTNVKEFKVFKSELLKYLNILNKIKNE